MNVKQLIVSAALASSLVIGAGAALAQGGNPQPGNPPGMSQPQGQAPGLMQPGIGGADLSALVEEYTGLSIADLRSALQDGQTLADLIAANGQTVADFIAAAQEAISTSLDTAVSEGRLTSDQAAQRLSQQVEQLSAWANGEDGAPGFDFLFGGADRGYGWFGDTDLSALVEEYTGLSVADLSAALQDGQTLADLIAANGQTVADFIAAAQEAISASLDTAVSEGRLTSDQAAQRLTQQEDQLTAWVNGEGGPLGPMGQGMGPGSGPGPMNPDGSNGI